MAASFTALPHAYVIFPLNQLINIIFAFLRLTKFPVMSTSTIWTVSSDMSFELVYVTCSVRERVVPLLEQAVLYKSLPSVGKFAWC